jgi:polar amino acid transport system substrate-binding protein
MNQIQKDLSAVVTVYGSYYFNQLSKGDHHMKKTTKVFILLLAAVLGLSLFTACNSNTAAPSASDSAAAPSAAPSSAPSVAPDNAGSDAPELVMATNAEFPPYEFYDGDNVVGIDVEIAQAIANKIGRTLRIDDIAFDSIIPAVQGGKADMGVAGMTVTKDRLQNVDFSDTYITASQVIIVKKDNTDIKTPDDLKGKTIGVQLGTTGDIYAEDIEGATLERYNKGFEAVQALQQGKIDAVIIDDQPAKVFASQNNDVTVIDEPFTKEDYAIAVKKGNSELLSQINAAIKELKDSGELQKIFDKYISD